MYRAFAFLSVCAFSAAAIADDSRTEPSKYQGSYQIVRGERDGKAIPDREIAGSTVEFKGNAIIGSDKDKKMFFACTFALDTKTTPQTISMTSTTPIAGEKSAGVIEISNDGTIKICYALPGGDVPTGFTTKQKQQCFVLKKTDR